MPSGGRGAAPQGNRYVDRILDLLGQQVEDFENDPMLWMEVYLVMLAGEMRLERAIEPIVQKLHLEGEILWEECVTALAKIGTDTAVEAITQGWQAAGVGLSPLCQQCPQADSR